MMTTVAHTKGPWSVTKTAAGKSKIVDDNGFSIANATTGSYAQQEIDARLIAAAPDLLAALQEAQHMFDGEYPGHPTTEKIRAAIAKATGSAA